jgi:tRNA threonylcarbamoyladenosine biosynthesis protein TsaB
MALILHIDTATEQASVCVSFNEQLLQEVQSADQKNHGSFLQPSIQQILQENSLTIQQIDAVAVTHGPGSYTGLRVGLASAKGICYALQKPLITINTLEVMAWATREHININALAKEPYHICPMIDARRMEVFTATYNQALEYISPTIPLILNEHSFEKELTKNKIVFSGNGSVKLKNILKNDNAIFVNVLHSSASMISLALNLFNAKSFSSIAYSEPYYGKEFYNPALKS